MFLDEVNTSSCVGLFKEIIVDRTFNGEVRDIDNQDSSYLGMAVQLYVQAHLGHYHILTQKGYSKKTDGTAEIYTLFTYICII